MNKNIILGAVLLFLFGMVACTDDLNQSDIDPDSITGEVVFKDATSAKMALAKVYGALAQTGTIGGDLSGDEGSSGFTRILFCLQELPTDEAKNCWGDGDLNDYNFMTWAASGGFNETTYNRIGVGISTANNFIAGAVALADDPEVQNFINEARFVRAYLYSVGMDLYGKLPIVTDLSNPNPVQASRTEVFEFVESELKEVEKNLSATQEYGRVSKYAATALLSRIYLNAEVYTGEARWAEAKAKAEEVINSGQFSLHSKYAELFMADNDTNGAQNEFLFVLPQDGQDDNFSGTTFFIHAAGGADMNFTSFGVNGGWYGNVYTGAFVDQFTEPTDARYMVHAKDGADARTKEILKDKGKISFVGNGYLSTKWTNLKSDGTAAPSFDASNTRASTDFAVIRLAEMYLNVAEVAVRMGDNATALTALNKLRARAGVSNLSSCDIETVFNERTKELYWECQRRTDLIRFGKFVSADYFWEYKGNYETPTQLDDKLKLYPIPSNVLLANPNLKQNQGY